MLMFSTRGEGVWCSLYYTIVTIIYLMKWKITALVWQCKSNVVIYKPYLVTIVTCTMATRHIVNVSDSFWWVLLIPKALCSSAPSADVRGLKGIFLCGLALLLMHMEGLLPETWGHPWWGAFPGQGWEVGQPLPWPTSRPIREESSSHDRQGDSPSPLPFYCVLFWPSDFAGCHT